MLEIINSYDDQSTFFRLEHILVEKYFNKHKIREYRINMDQLKLCVDTDLSDLQAVSDIFRVGESEHTELWNFKSMTSRKGFKQLHFESVAKNRMEIKTKQIIIS